MKNILKKTLSLLLALCLLLGFVPAGNVAHAAPSGLELTYTGQDQALVTAEPGYTYALNPNGPFYEYAPTADGPGTYIVHCKSKFDGTVIPVTTYIRPVAEQPTVFTGLVYNGGEQTIAKAADNSRVFVEGSSWGEEATASNAGTYTVYYQTSMHGIDSEIGQTEVTIAPKQLTPIKPEFNDHVYSGDTLFQRDLQRLEGKCGDDAVIGFMTYKLDKADAGTVNWQSGSFRLSGEDANNYYIDKSTSFSGTTVVAPLPITVTADSGQSISYLDSEPELTYSVSTTNPDYSFNLNGALRKSPLQGKLSREAGENVGKYEIRQGSLTNEANPNYIISFVPADFEIKPYELNIEGLVAEDKVYNGTTSAVIKPNLIHVANLPAGYKMEKLVYTAAFASPLVGENVPVNFSSASAKVTNDKGEDVSRNFTFSIKPTTANITPATVSVKGLKLDARDYDGTDNVYRLQLQDEDVRYENLPSGLTVEISGEIIGKYDSRHAGADKPVTIDDSAFTVIDGNNNDLSDCFKFEVAPLSGGISKAKLNFSVIYNLDKTYDGTDSSNIGLEIGKLNSKDDVSISYKANYTGSDAGSSYDIHLSDVSLSGSDAGNYYYEGSTYRGSIEYAELIVTPKDMEIEYLDEEPVILYDVIGLLPGDELSGSLSRAAGSTPGSYAINRGTLASPNYFITLTPKNFVIKNRSISVEGLSAADKDYDGTTEATVSHGSTITFGNVPEGYDFSGFENITVSSADFADANTGTDKPVKALIRFNYNEDKIISDLQYFNFVPANLSADIRPLAYEITVNETEKTYGQAEPSFTSDAPEALVIVREEGDDAGEYEFVIESGASGNYAYSFKDKFSINKAGIADTTQAVSSPDKVYTGAELDGLDSAQFKLGDYVLVKDKDYTVSGNLQTKLGRYTISFNGTGNFEGLVTSYFSILPPEVIEDVLDGTIKPENVSLSDKAALELLEKALATIDENTSHPELEDWEDAAEKLPAIMSALDRLEAALAIPDTSEADALEKAELEVSDKETLEDAVKALEKHLDDYGDLLGDAANKELEEKIKVYEDMIAVIEEAEELCSSLEKWLKKYLPLADADELWLRAEYQKQLRKVRKLSDAAEDVIYNTLGKKLGTMEEKLYTYYVVKGHNQRWLTTSKDGAEFTCNGHISLFKGVYVDEKLVDEKYYSVESGSTIIEFSNEYMKSLEKGKHQIQFRYEDGYSAVGLFRVADHDTPQTSDTSDPALWLGLMLMSAAGIFVILRRRKELFE